MLLASYLTVTADRSADDWSYEETMFDVNGVSEELIWYTLQERQDVWFYELNLESTIE